MAMNWGVITDLGDSAVMAPACLAIAAWLVLSRAYRDAVRWLTLFGAAAGLVLCTKVAFLGWGIGVAALDFTGASGHATSATGVFGVAGFLVGSKASRIWGLSGAAIGCGLGALIAFSRIMVGAHSGSEVAVGCLIGATVVLGMMTAPRPLVLAAPRLLSLTLVAIVITQHGGRAPSEAWITELSLILSGHSQPYSRGDWSIHT